MKKFVLILFVFLIISAAVIWLTAAKNDRFPADAAPEKPKETTVRTDSIQSPPPEISELKENIPVTVHEPETPVSDDTSVDISADSAENTASAERVPESSDASSETANSVVEDMPDEVPPAESEKQAAVLSNIPETEKPAKLTDTPEQPTEKDEIIPAADTENAQKPQVKIAAVDTPLSKYKGFDEYSVSDFGKISEYVVGIPERSWPDSHRVRRELTEEIAEKYPYKPFDKRTMDNNAWEPGEKLTFSIDYGFYSAGTATMSVLGVVQANGAECYHIRTVAVSNAFISAFYPVSDSVNSYIDYEGLFSRRFEKKLREGSYRSDRIVDFYPNRRLALNTVEKHAVTEIPLFTQDILSSLYILRTHDLEVGRDEVIDVYADGKVYPLDVVIHKIETVKVPAGKFECYVVEPILKSEGIFRQKGKLTIWLTCDNLKLPVKMKSKVTIGSISTNLEKYSTGVIQ